MSIPHLGEIFTIFQLTLERTKKSLTARYWMDPYEPEYYNVDGYSISFKIPFDGDANLLYLKPSTFIMTRFSVSSVTAPQGEELGSLVIVIENTKDNLKVHSDN